MALDIWLPLIGNTVNQGTRPVSITASSPAYSTFGKIGEVKKRIVPQKAVQ
mgnify:CR=1 FL=1